MKYSLRAFQPWIIDIIVEMAQDDEWKQREKKTQPVLLIRKKGYDLRDLNSVDFEIQIPHYLGGERKEEEEEKMQRQLAKS